MLIFIACAALFITGAMAIYTRFSHCELDRDPLGTQTQAVTVDGEVIILNKDLHPTRILDLE